MKKTAALLCALALLLQAAPALGEFTLDFFRQNEGVFQVNEDEAQDIAFIETGYTPQELAFEHKYESPENYSLLESDILVMHNASSEERRPVLRTWIHFSTTQRLDVSSVTFALGGTSYTLTGISDPDWVIVGENDTRENLLIRYGTNNAEFVAALMAEALSYTYLRYGEETTEEPPVPQMTMTLHGAAEDLEIEVPAGFWLDFGMLTIAMMQTDSLSYIGQNAGTACAIEGPEAEDPQEEEAPEPEEQPAEKTDEAADEEASEAVIEEAEAVVETAAETVEETLEAESEALAEETAEEAAE